MTNEQFEIEMEKSFLRSKQIIGKKKLEYASDTDRLHNFKQTAAMESKPPTETLFSMADKHIASIADMVKDPHKYTLKQWHSKTVDLRNYTILLEAVLIDIGVE